MVTAGQLRALARWKNLKNLASSAVGLSRSIRTYAEGIFAAAGFVIEIMSVNVLFDCGTSIGGVGFVSQFAYAKPSRTVNAIPGGRSSWAHSPFSGTNASQ